jgi:phage gp45-like
MVTRDQIEKVVAQVTKPLRVGFRTMVQRAVLRSVTEGGKTQLLKVKIVGNHERRAENFQPAGLTSFPSSGEGVALAITGKGDAYVLVGLHNRDKRPTDRSEGETELYAEFDNSVILDDDGDCIMQPKSGGDVILGEQEATKSAALALAIAQKVETELEALRTTINTHTHVVAGAVGGGAGLTSNTGLPQAGAIGDTASSNVKGKS